MLVTFFGNLAETTVGLPRALQDGEWHAYRLSLMPDGEAWLLADGQHLAGPVRVNVRAHPFATLVIEGRSVGTTVLVDEVRVSSGTVRPDR